MGIIMSKILRKVQVAIQLLLIIMSFTTYADDFAKLNEAVPNTQVKTISPVFDFDTDGCLPSAGISRTGAQNSGLGTTGDLGGDCRSSNFLDTSNLIHRSLCNTVGGNVYCGHFYAIYFEKDQTTAAGCSICGHRHDWEHVTIWTTNNVVTHGGASAHGGMATKALSEIPRDSAGHIKIVYHKDGGGTHALRFASSDESAENPYSNFVTPTIISWFNMIGDGINNADLRNKLNTFDYGDASLDIRDSVFISRLNQFKPSGYPQFTLEGETEDCYLSDKFSEEQSAQSCLAAYTIKGLECSGSYCDSKRLLCCRTAGLTLSGSIANSPAISEEAPNSYTDQARAVVGMECHGKYCDQIILKMQSIQGQGPNSHWTTPISDEQGLGKCNNNSSYVAGIKCEGRYCDNVSLYCKERQ